jgi:cellobiuronic acid synthase
MLAFVVEARAFVLSGRVYPFAVLMAVIWALRIVRVLLARRYKPWLRPCGGPVSVLIPGVVHRLRVVEGHLRAEPLHRRRHVQGRRVPDVVRAPA